MLPHHQQNHHWNMTGITCNLLVVKWVKTNVVNLIWGPITLFFSFTIKTLWKFQLALIQLLMNRSPHFYSWHDGCDVGAYAKLCCDIWLNFEHYLNGMERKHIFPCFWILVEKAWVKWVPGRISEKVLTQIIPGNNSRKTSCHRWPAPQLARPTCRRSR